MTITEVAILIFKSPPDFSDPALQSHFDKLSSWQAECSGFPLVFFTNPDDPLQIHLVTGWTSVAAHEAWIRGEWNQELLRLFAPYIDMPKIRMVHVGIDFEAIPGSVEGMIVERYRGSDDERVISTRFESEGEDQSTWSLVGRDLTQDHGEVFRFVGGGSGEFEIEGVFKDPIARCALKRVKP